MMVPLDFRTCTERAVWCHICNVSSLFISRDGKNVIIIDFSKGFGEGTLGVTVM